MKVRSLKRKFQQYQVRHNHSPLPRRRLQPDSPCHQRIQFWDEWTVNQMPNREAGWKKRTETPEFGILRLKRKEFKALTVWYVICRKPAETALKTPAFR